MADADRPRLPPVVKSLGLVSFFNDFASEMVYPLLPALLTRTLGSGAVALGALDGVAEAVASLFKLVSGRLADRRGWRRPLVIGGYVIATIARPVMGVAGAAWQVIGLRGVDRFGKGIRTPPRDAVIADAAPPALRGRAFGFHRAMDHAGAVIGPLIAFAVLSVWHWSPDKVIVWSVVPGIVAVAVVMWAMKRERAPDAVSREDVGGENVSRDVNRDDVSPDDASMFTLIVAFSFVRFPETLLLLRLQDLGLAIAFAPLVWAALHVVRMVFSYPGGTVSDRLGPERTMLFGWLAYAGVVAGLAWARTAPVAVLWFLAFGLVAALTESPERALVARAAGARRRGRGFGFYHASIGLAALPGAVVLGWLYERQGALIALAASAGAAAVLYAAGAVGLLLDRRRA